MRGVREALGGRRDLRRCCWKAAAASSAVGGTRAAGVEEELRLERWPVRFAPLSGGRERERDGRLVEGSRGMVFLCEGLCRFYVPVYFIICFLSPILFWRWFVEYRRPWGLVCVI